MMSMLVRRTVVALGVASGFGLPLPIAAQEQEKDEKEQRLEKIIREADNPEIFTFDFDVPSSPGTTLLGLKKDQITQSNSLKPFVLSLPNVFGSDEEGQAVAFDASIGALVVPSSEQRYQTYRSRAIIFRTRVNVALYQGNSDQDPTKETRSRVAAGLSSSLLNSSDPLLASIPGQTGAAYVNCLNSIKDEHDRKLPRLTGDTAQDDKNAAEFIKSFPLKKYADICVAAADRAARIGADLDIGGGFFLDGDPGQLDGLDEEGGVVWASFRTALGVTGVTNGNSSTITDYKEWVDDLDRWTMIGGWARAGLNEAIPTGDATTPQIRADTFTGWLGLESSSKTNRFSGQIGYEEIVPKLAANDSFGGSRLRYSVAYDQAVVGQDIWVSLSYGRAEGVGNLKSDATFRVALLFNVPSSRNIFGGI